MTEVISVRFKSGGKAYFFDPNGIQAEAGRPVIVETAKGLEYGECCRENHEVPDDSVIPPLRPVIRTATEEDVRTVQENKLKEKRAFAICREKIREHKLEMKLVSVEYNFEGSKILFFFTADGRVDFRDLVKDLAAVFKTRIELRQIGVRDETKMLGGLGICGKQFCCAGFLSDFQPVSIKMAKSQSLSLNPAKISGTCGRLMCCLKYEQDAYEDLLKRTPKAGTFVNTPMGKGTITDVNLLREKVKVRLENNNDMALKTFSLNEISTRSGKLLKDAGNNATEKAGLPLEEHIREETPEPADNWAADKMREAARPEPAPEASSPAAEEGKPPIKKPRVNKKRRNYNGKPKGGGAGNTGETSGKKASAPAKDSAPGKKDGAAGKKESKAGHKGGYTGNKRRKETN